MQIWNKIVGTEKNVAFLYPGLQGQYELFPKDETALLDKFEEFVSSGINRQPGIKIVKAAIIFFKSELPAHFFEISPGSCFSDMQITDINPYDYFPAHLMIVENANIVDYGSWYSAERRAASFFLFEMILMKIPERNQLK